MKWYNYETFNEQVKNELRKFLKENNIYYELSSCFDGWHFEIKLEEKDCERINWFLDTMNEYIV